MSQTQIKTTETSHQKTLPAIARGGSTLLEGFDRSGVGLHSGQTTRVRVLPAEAGERRYFVRTDLSGTPYIPAEVEAVRQTQLSTELATGDASVRTVEHLLAALAARGIDRARIEIDGPELPLLDGSAKPWIDAIDRAGQTESQTATVAYLDDPLWVRDGDAFVAALPSPELRLSYGIDFDARPIGNQWHSWTPLQEDFSQAIAPARTFGLAEDVDRLRSAGLIRGGSLENALVCDLQHWLNPPLRFANEPARHKILDLVGDLSLLGTIPVAHFIAYKASHRLHVRLTQRLRERGLSQHG
ncbi:UDP-3-O-[3-hydroxymyristoyl] N-acetylglucosamine deacetylase [Geitlerinema sp. FC II]|nr:UDP-3-O-[3-hydroxymyristoyl] N-acetylglucosamine deacetylase [Geitlerinema sp. FC II]